MPVVSTLSEIRNAVFRQTDWAPTQSPDAVARVNEFINRALVEVAMEAPYLFFEDTVHFATQPDVSPTSATDLLSVDANDRWVLARTAGVADWTVDGTWDGRHIEVTDSNGLVHRRKIRTLWTSGNDQFLTLDRPWPNGTDTGMTYRIYTDDYYFSDDMIQMNSVRLYRYSQNYPLAVLGRREAEELLIADSMATSATGVPNTIFRRDHFKLPSPNTAAVISSTVSNGWHGPERPGAFEYCYTYAWGRRDFEFSQLGPTDSGTNDADRYEPLWESSPSPILSAPYSDSNGDTDADSYQQEFPDIDFVQAFGTTGVATIARENRTGWYIRIYRRRLTQLTGIAAIGPGLTSPPARQEVSQAFYFLAEISGATHTFEDTGAITPDYFRRLRRINGYQAMKFYPRPNVRYEVDVRCVREPPALLDDTDSPPIDTAAMNILIYKTLEFLYEAQGNVQMTEKSRMRYEKELFTMTKRFGDMKEASRPEYRKFARARPGRRGASRRWWGTTPYT